MGMRPWMRLAFKAFVQTISPESTTARACVARAPTAPVSQWCRLWVMRADAEHEARDRDAIAIRERQVGDAHSYLCGTLPSG